MIGRIILVTLSSICAVTSLSYATDVSGDVWGEWTSAGNPYNVVGDLRVPPGSSLVIGPGCYVEFQGYYEFVIDPSALFQAIGTESDSIIFTSADSLLGWDGFLFFHADSGSQFNYCRIEYAHGHGNTDAGGIRCQYSFFVLRNSLITNNYQTSVVSLRESNNAIIDNNSFILNHGTGVIFSIRNSSLEISENIFSNNDSAAIINVGNENGVLIRDNIFHDNNYCDLIMDSGSETVVERNIIYNNLAAIFNCFLASGSIYRKNIIYDNHLPAQPWGAIFSSEDADYTVENNTICNNSSVYGSYLGWFGESYGIGGPILFYNNIIWGNSYRNPENSLFIMLGDIIFDQIYSDVQGGWDGIGNIIADPMFVDTANSDFHLMPGSPCIDAGDPASPYDPDGTIADMGALYFDQTTGINFPNLLPINITLHQNYPNPFNASTVIKFELPEEGRVSIDVYDILGRGVSSIIGGYYKPGTHEVTWDGVSRNGKRLPSGIYLYKLKNDTFEQTRKMILLK